MERDHYLAATVFRPVDRTPPAFDIRQGKALWGAPLSIRFDKLGLAPIRETTDEWRRVMREDDGKHLRPLPL